MVFVEEEVDKRGKLYKAVKSVGRIVEFGRQDERSLMRWILSSVKKEGKQITESAMRLFLEKAGDDMGNIQMELEKLFCYTLDKNEILPEDVEEICITRTENKIFDMIRCRGSEAAEKSHGPLLRSPGVKRAPHADSLPDRPAVQSASADERAEKPGLRPEQHRLPHENPALHRENSWRQMESFTYEELERAVRECVEAEEAVKTGCMNDQMSVEMLIVMFTM